MKAPTVVSSKTAQRRRRWRRLYGDFLVAEEQGAALDIEPGLKSYTEVLGCRPTPDGRDVDDSWNEILRWAQSLKKEPQVRKAIRERRNIFVMALKADGRSFRKRRLNRSMSRWLDEERQKGKETVG